MVPGSPMRASGDVMPSWGRQVREVAMAAVSSEPFWPCQWLRARVEWTHAHEDVGPWAALPATLDALLGVVFARPRQVRELTVTARVSRRAAMTYGRPQCRIRIELHDQPTEVR